MAGFFTWLEAHDKLAGWAQFAGAMIAMGLTYFTAFAPIWRRKRQLNDTAKRLLMNGYEVIESYHRTSAHFLPTSLSLRFAMQTMESVIAEIGRFPIYELDDQGSRSIARNLVAIGGTLGGIRLYLESMALELDSRDGTEEDQANIRELIRQQMDVIEKILSGAPLNRPEPPSHP